MKQHLLIFLILLLASCAQKRGSAGFDAPAIKISINPLDSQTVFIEDIADSVYAVSLKTTKDFFVTHVTNFFATDSLIIIADRSQSAVLIFDQQGIPKTSIHQQGNQPGQYASMTDVIYDEQLHQVEILDLSQNKIFRYDISGKLIDVLEIIGSRYFGLTFAKSKGMYVSEIVNNNKEMTRLRVYKEKETMVTYHSQQLSFFPLIRELDVAYPHQFDNYRDSVFYFPLLDDKIYSITLNAAVPVYQVEAPKENLITDDIKAITTIRDHFAYWKKMEAANIIYDNNSLFITDRWVSFRYDFQSRISPRNVFFSKKTGKVLQLTEYNSRKDTSFRSRNRILGKAGDYFVMKVPSPAPPKPGQEKNSAPQEPIHLMFFRLKEF
ncbi:6-bladed beta-propeller [Chitinophaga sp. 22321]|uniref:6-bladed beta-propeller n=1 Tax=Chitinophaga hostae TaxID=2831022 RepID=A0ABS5J6A9_9BACT|nr:6-bladed beta-propeller [Chitinophaga hostae]MBS0030705.1 6-bladed beta-propeller [Chitinophaga hostae]